MLSLDPSRLIKEELEYEFPLRNIQPSGCKDLVKLVTEFLWLEKSGKVFTSLIIFHPKVVSKFANLG